MFVNLYKINKKCKGSFMNPKFKFFSHPTFLLQIIRMTPATFPIVDSTLASLRGVSEGSPVLVIVISLGYMTVGSV